MATPYPTETQGWAAPNTTLTNGSTFDTPQTRITVTDLSSTGGGYLQTSAGNGETPGATRVVNSQLTAGSSRQWSFEFGDNPAGDSTKEVPTVENLTFQIFDVDAGRAGDGYQDVVKIAATDAGNKPLTISVSPNDAGATYDVAIETDASGKRWYVLSGKDGSGLTTARTPATITISGPVDRIDFQHLPGRTSASGSQIYIGPMTYLPSTDICFAAGTLVRTPTGEVAVETLKVGDLVMTRDNGAQPVRWIDSTRRALRRGSRLAPVRIRAGALGDNLPESDLLVSPQHRMLVRSAIAQRMFGTDEVLVAAKQLLQIDGIDIADDLDEVVYVHFIFDRHEIVYANGAESESLYTGPEALKTLSPQAREEILALFPDLAEDALPEPARVLASGRLGRKLAVRHAQNDKPLV
ncbi:Hint domain-containing protein [Paracoccus sanguinis]|uniref:Hint domain-containing protein n=1 Tax=Paracoccus sanguinis TaxID=1545044 RepID=UPI0012E05835|nr:Hint domain-containing protein [Paracoccus sanguinis]